MPGRFGSPWWHQQFVKGGYRITEPRQAILRVLNKTGEHVSAEDVYHQVHKEYPNIGLTTVYRTLDLLVDMGVVSKFDFGDGRARYELSKGPRAFHHHHLVCRGCGRVIDYTDYLDDEIKMVKKVESILERKHSFKIDSHQLHFYGVCEGCQSE